MKVMFIFSIAHIIILTSCTTPEKADFAIHNVTLIDVSNEVAKPGMTVLINGTRISKIGQIQRKKLSKETIIVDGTEKYLIPGLWDMHVHPYTEDKPIDVIGKEFHSIFIVNGITSVRVMLGSPLSKSKEKSISKNLIMPRKVIASPLASGRASGGGGSYGVSNEEKGRQFVQKAYKTGADFVKLGSFIPRDAYFAMTDEAKKLGIQFAGHVPYSISGIEASDAGQVSIEHQYSILIPCSSKENEITTNLLDKRYTNRNRVKIYSNIDYDEQKAKQFFTHLIKNDTYVCPTLVVWNEFSNLNKEQLFNDSRFNYMPLDIRERWANSYENLADEELKAGLKKMNSKTQHIVNNMNNAGVKILAGTDNGIPFVFQGFSLHKELELLVESGLTPMEAIQTATYYPAECTGRLDSLGTIEVGKIADLVLLEHNPLHTIRNTKKINSVFQNGKYYDRAQLDKILENIHKLVHQE